MQSLSFQLYEDEKTEIGKIFSGGDWTEHSIWPNVLNSFTHNIPMIRSLNFLCRNDSSINSEFPSWNTSTFDSFTNQLIKIGYVLFTDWFERLTTFFAEEFSKLNLAFVIYQIAETCLQNIRNSCRKWLNPFIFYLVIKSENIPFSIDTTKCTFNFQWTRWARYKSSLKRHQMTIKNLCTILKCEKCLMQIRCEFFT